jgi:hypothetical protein
MVIDYIWAPGDRVYVASEGQYGEVKTVVPGNGSIPWYFVETDDGQEDRYTADQLSWA